MGLCMSLVAFKERLIRPRAVKAVYTPVGPDEDVTLIWADKKSESGPKERRVYHAGE